MGVVVNENFLVIPPFVFGIIDHRIGKNPQNQTAPVLDRHSTSQLKRLQHPTKSGLWRFGLGRMDKEGRLDGCSYNVLCILWKSIV